MKKNHHPQHRKVHTVNFDVGTIHESYSKDPFFWNNEDVTDWLNRIKLSRYCAIVEHKGINGRDLLTQKNSFNVTTNDSMKLSKAIKKLKLESNEYNIWKMQKMRNEELTKQKNNYNKTRHQRSRTVGIPNHDLMEMVHFSSNESENESNGSQTTQSQEEGNKKNKTNKRLKNKKKVKKPPKRLRRRASQKKKDNESEDSISQSSTVEIKRTKKRSSKKRKKRKRFHPRRRNKSVDVLNVEKDKYLKAYNPQKKNKSQSIKKGRRNSFEYGSSEGTESEQDIVDGILNGMGSHHQSSSETP